jgi:hypothetical protein
MTNPILSLARDYQDKGDAWGSNINFLFALCDIATVFGVEDIPEELEFTQSPFGAATEAYEYQAMLELFDELTLEEFTKHIVHALKVLAKYDSLLRLAGKDY